MVKVLTGVQPGQVSEAEAEVIAGAPTAELKERVPQAQGLDSLLQEASVEDVSAGIEAGVQEELQRETERVPTLHERAADTTTVHEWTAPAQAAMNVKQGKVPPKSADGGLKRRAATMAETFSSPNSLASLAITPTTVGRPHIGDPQALAQAEAEVNPGSLIAALNRSGAVTTEQNPETRSFENTIDPMYLNVLSAVTENTMADLAFGEGETVEGIQQEEGDLPQVSKAQGNANLGQQIHREYSRIKNKAEGRPTDEYQDLPNEEAITLGDAAKEMFAIANPGFLNRTDVGAQTYFQLTPEGVDAIKAGAWDRKRLFPKQQVRPAKAPVRAQKLPGEQGRTHKRSKKYTGGVKAEGVVGGKVLEEAAENLSTVANVVDPQRMKILFLTALPVLSGQIGIDSPMAEINGVGASKMSEYETAEKLDRDKRLSAQMEGKKLKGQPYSAEAEMNAEQNKLAQSIRAIAQERHGANYLTYTIQAATGRMSPNQTVFDPTTSKAVRFVTRNAVPAKATPGTRIDRNLRQMYALMLVAESHIENPLKKNKMLPADALLPAEREIALERNSNRLETWGDRLLEVLNASMSDAEAEAIANAIEQGIPLTDPQFPQVKSIAFDPQRDAELIQAIKDKGEDGQHFIDGLIDYSKYAKARRAGRPYYSYFNAYIDGKTNGIASAGMQMGIRSVAEKTGVIRSEDSRILLNDHTDIRDEMAKQLTESIANGWEGSISEVHSELNDVAHTIFNFRDLNKATTMTFGYGKELASFRNDINEAIEQKLSEESANPESSYPSSLAVLDSKLEKGRADLINLLHGKYVEALERVLSDEVMKSRAIMRSVATVASLTDQLFSIKTHTGFQLNLGGDITEGAETAESTRYGISGPGAPKQPRAYRYKTRGTSGAVKVKGSEYVGEEGTVAPGLVAYGQSLPSPIQSLDAATVAMSAAGKSWDRLKTNSGGHPYMHTIYDAFKMDAMGFDVMMQEVNKNWLEATTKWSYLKEAQDSLNEMQAKWKDKVKDREALQQKIDVSPEGDYGVLGWFMEQEETAAGNLWYFNMHKRLKNIMERPKGLSNKEWDSLTAGAVKNIVERMTDKQWSPENARLGHVDVFYRALMDELNLNARLSNLIKVTDKNKAELVAEIRRSNAKADPLLKYGGQYYAH